MWEGTRNDTTTWMAKRRAASDHKLQEESARHHPLTREWVTTSHASVFVATKFAACAIDRYSDGMYLDGGGGGWGGLRSHVSSTPPVQTHLSAHTRPSPPLASSEIESYRACRPALALVDPTMTSLNSATCHGARLLDLDIEAGRRRLRPTAQHHREPARPSAEQAGLALCWRVPRFTGRALWSRASPRSGDTLAPG